MPTIGILLPRSTYYNSIGFDLFQGLRSGMTRAGREDIRIVTENIGFGAEKNTVYRAAEKMIMEDNVSVVLAYITPRSAQLLRPLFMSSNRLLIVLDSGASLPQEWPATPNILYHSLHNALGAWYSGKLAAQSGNKEGGMVTGYYDGGYLHTAALTYGYTQHGGNIQFNHATGFMQSDFKMEPLRELRANHEGSCLLSLFSGDFNEWFLRDIKSLYGDNCPPIYKAPFGLEETMLEKSVHTGQTIRGYASWSKHLQNPQNAVFIETLQEAGFTPNLFSLLGWEAADLAIAALDLMTTHKNNGRLVTEELKSFTFDSPRGSVHFHKEYNTTLAPLYQVDVVANEEGNCQIAITDVVSEVDSDFEQMAQIELEGTISGWFNSYVCN